MPPEPAAAERLVLYDGVCGLCDRTVQFLVPRDQGKLTYAPLQGPTAARLRERHPEIPTELASVIYVEDGRVYARSKAFLVLAKHLTWPWRAFSWLRWLPGALFDPFYWVIAKLRYRIWGKLDACRLPAPAERARFLP